MNDTKDAQKVKLSIIIALMKAMCTVFTGIAVTGILSDIIAPDILYVQVRIMLVLGTMAISWWQWFSINNQPRLWEQPRLVDYAELLFYTVIVTWILYASQPETSIFKLTYIFIIMANAFRFDMRYGFISAGISSASVIFCDAAKLEQLGRFAYLEQDMLLIVSFFVLAFIMGYISMSQKQDSENMARMATTDELTGLYNNRVFHESLLRYIEEISDNRRYENVWVVLLDIAEFRRYNELYGYTMGNAVLTQAGGIISQGARDAQLVSRYGDDKFGLIFTNCSLGHVKDIVSCIRRNIENYPFYGKDNMPGGVITVYAGIAGYPMNGLTKEQMIKSAVDNINSAKLIYNNIDPIRMVQMEGMDVMQVFINMLNSRDHYTYEHTKRVIAYADMLARALNTPQRFIDDIKCGAYLHDIGKIDLPTSILLKTQPLSVVEDDIFKNHVIWGADIVGSVESLAHIVPIIRHHHERWDGFGYPDGLRGADIPLEARIVALANGFDMMLMGRWPDEPNCRGFADAAQCLMRNAGTYFDPDLADIFIKTIQSYNLQHLFPNDAFSVTINA
ncbi:MAG: hypothetical protein PWP55_558 [Clostridiales bacterium]|nr:hypothetical protein [Clostridiales bacterium]